MATRHPDRRVRRTKQRLKDALMGLLAQRDYDEITIRDLTRRADVGRSTFYSHFASKEELLFSGFDEWLRSVAGAAAAREGGATGTDEDPAEVLDEESGRPPRAPGGAPRFRFSLPLLRHAREQKRFFRATVEQASSPRVRRRIVALLAEAARRELEGSPRTAEGADVGRSRQSPTDHDRALDAEAHAVAGAFLGLLSWWLSEGEDLDADAADRIFQRTVAGERAGPA